MYNKSLSMLVVTVRIRYMTAFGADSPPGLPCVQADCCGRRSLVTHHRLKSQKQSVSKKTTSQVHV